MKIFSALLLTLTTVSAFASSQSIPKAKLAAYQQAATLAIVGKAFDCQTVSGILNGNVVNRIAASTSGQIDTSGAQPLLIFIFEEGPKLNTISITTSSDFKSISSMRIEDSVKSIEDVNTGDLQNPVIVKQTVLKSVGVGVCNKL